MRSAALLCALALAGCGGGGEGTTAASPATTNVVSVTLPEDTANPEEKPTGAPEFTITLEGESDEPVAGTRWRYVVTARRADGGAAAGTAKMRVFVEGALADTIGYFGFSRRLARTFRWSAVLRGKKGVVLQAEVEGEGGTQRANFPVTVR
jgi:hypothetical protein